MLSSADGSDATPSSAPTTPSATPSSAHATPSATPSSAHATLTYTSSTQPTDTTSTTSQTPCPTCNRVAPKNYLVAAGRDGKEGGGKKTCPGGQKAKRSKLLLRLKMTENTVLSAVEWSHLAQEMRPLTNESSVICAICGSTWSAQRWRKCQTLGAFTWSIVIGIKMPKPNEIVIGLKGVG